MVSVYYTPARKEETHGKQNCISGMGAKLSYKGNYSKKIGNSYYLYKRISRRVPGKKYPQPVDTYIGVITPEGVVKSTRKKIDLRQELK